MATGDPIQAVRSGPGEFFLATERIETGLRFRVADSTYEVVGAPSPVGFLVVIARVRIVEGAGAGHELQARLHGGQRANP